MEKKGFRKLTSTKCLTGMNKEVPPDETIICPECKGAAVKKYHWGWDGSTLYDKIICEKCETDAACRKLQDAESKRRDRIMTTKNHAGIHGRLQDWSFDSYQANCDGQKVALEAARNYYDRWTDGKNPGWLALLGKNGTGKCHLALSIANLMIETSDRVKIIYIKLIRLMRRIRATYSNGTEETEEQVISDIDSAHLLILDEFGIRDELSGWERATLDDILDQRWEQNKPLIVMSNMNAKDLMNLAGERINSRFAEMGQIVKFTWDDWRKASRKKE